MDTAQLRTLVTAHLQTAHALLALVAEAETATQARAWVITDELKNWGKIPDDLQEEIATVRAELALLHQMSDAIKTAGQGSAPTVL